MTVVTSYDPYSQFTMSALSQLKDVGIPVMFSLDTKIQLLQQIFSTLVPDAYAHTQSKSLLNDWLSSGMSSCLLPTWKNLLLIIRLLNLDELAQRMETYLSGAQHSKMGTIKHGGESTLFFYA